MRRGLVMLMMVLPAAAAGQQVVGGRALDNNLMVGSGGFNSPNRGGRVNSAALDRPQYGIASNPRTNPAVLQPNMYYYSTGSVSGSRPFQGAYQGTGGAGVKP